MAKTGLAAFAIAAFAVVATAGLAGVFVVSYVERASTLMASTSKEAASKGPVGIVVSRATVDKTNADTSSGFTLYIYDVTLTGNGTSGTTYNASASPALTLPQAVTLTNGQRVSGELGFSVADCDAPSRLV